MSEEARDLAEREKLRLLPVCITRDAKGVHFRRGCTELRVDGNGVERIVDTLLSVLKGRSLVPEQIYEAFRPLDRPVAADLVQELKKRRFIVNTTDYVTEISEPETQTDIFYWHFAQTNELIRSRFSQRQITVIGVNVISRELIGY